MLPGADPHSCRIREPARCQHGCQPLRLRPPGRGGQPQGRRPYAGEPGGTMVRRAPWRPAGAPSCCAGATRRAARSSALATGLDFLVQSHAPLMAVLYMAAPVVLPLCGLHVEVTHWLLT